MVIATPPMTETKELRCWRCRRKIGETEGVKQGIVLLVCPRCSARNSFDIQAIDKGDNNNVK